MTEKDKVSEESEDEAPRKTKNQEIGEKTDGMELQHPIDKSDSDQSLPSSESLNSPILSPTRSSESDQIEDETPLINGHPFQTWGQEFTHAHLLSPIHEVHISSHDSIEMGETHDLTDSPQKPHLLEESSSPRVPPFWGTPEHNNQLQDNSFSPIETGTEGSDEKMEDEMTGIQKNSDDDVDRFHRMIMGKPIEETSQDSPHRDDTHFVPSPSKKKDRQGLHIKNRSEFQSDQESTQPVSPSTADTPTPPGGHPISIDLPQRVPERDLGATQVNAAAYGSFSPPTSPRRHRFQFYNRLGGFRGCGGCLIRMGILGLFGLIAVLIVVASFTLYQYSVISATLPSVEDLQERAAQFETTRILDREGNLLYEILDPQAGRRTYVSLDGISPYMVAAIISTEDSQFYSHPGFDPWAIVRAFWQSTQEGDIASGASTITQQIARTLLLSPEERSRRTALRKIREILLAAEITRRYTKDEILELYLNQSYFGNMAYGVEAAAETYFNTTANKLTLAQASFLAGLVQAPSVYDIHTNRDATLTRHQQILTLMVLTSNEQGCIFVSNNPQPICVSPEDANAAATEITNYEFRPISFNMRFPHWVNFIRSELEKLYDPQTIYRSGFTVYTTLDPYLQEQAQDIVLEQVEALVDQKVSNGALVAVRPNTGEILAMVGSADFNNEEIDGQVNMAIRPRQPGSSIKPLTYTAAFENGWTPSTLIWDVPSEFPPSGNDNDTRPPYKPVNYDGRFHGPVTVRTALANSYNVPAVKTLDFIGIYDDPNTEEAEGFIAFAQRMGITTLTRDDYGLALTLGGGEVTLLEMTGAFAIFANGGERMPPYAISKIVDHKNEIVYEYVAPHGEVVIRPEHAYLISSILSDNDARRPMFGANSLLYLPFQVAAKTGTTTDFRDNWTMGYTPDIAVGVWVGNADWTPMQNTTGLTGAAPIWNKFIQIAIEQLTGGHPTPFTAPAGIIEKAVCVISGAEPSEWCPSHRLEIFASDQPPLPKEQDLWQKVWIDSWSLKLASSECAEFTKEKLGLDVIDPWARKWILENSAGKAWAEEIGFPEDKVYFIPRETCTVDSSRPIVSLTFPVEESIISTSPITVIGMASATSNFQDWVLQYGLGTDPSSWIRITQSEEAHEQTDNLVEWIPEEIFNGYITLRLVVRSTEGGNAEDRVHFILDLATPTPTITPTETATPTPSETPTPTETISPTPTYTPTNTNTPTPSDTPTPSETYTPSVTPTS